MMFVILHFTDSCLAVPLLKTAFQVQDNLKKKNLPCIFKGSRFCGEIAKTNRQEDGTI